MDLETAVTKEMMQMPTTSAPHRDLANAIWALSMDAVEAADSGHPGMPIGMADVATVLFTRFLKFDPVAPDWPDRDRFMTRDSIGLGEDGPTHQPVEHFGALRAIPNLMVVRPADAIETAESWAVAIASKKTPSVLCLTRQGLPALPSRAELETNLVTKGPYTVHEPVSPREVTILTTGSEVQLALDAAKNLEAEGIATAAVSMPCWELFRQQPEDYRHSVLGSAPRIAVEAGVRLGWDEWIGPDGAFIGMTGFGASALAPAIYEQFGITPEAVMEAANSAARR
jgi:transketolase